MGLSAKAKQLQRTLENLWDNQPDDLRLRDHLEGVRRDEALPGLTWFWGPELYRRNRVVFREFIWAHFRASCPWSKQRERLEDWLVETRRHRDVWLTRRLLSWKFLKYNPRLCIDIDLKAWRRELVREYQAAEGLAAQAVVLQGFDRWFPLDEPTALTLYSVNPACSKFLLAHLAFVITFPGRQKRELWRKLFAAARAANDDEFAFALYRRQVAIKEWQRDVLRLADEIPDPDNLTDELLKRHPESWPPLKPVRGTIALLRRRGRDVMPYVREKLNSTVGGQLDLGMLEPIAYVREKLNTIVGGWSADSPSSLLKLARKRGWWDLWAATARLVRDPMVFNKAVGGLLSDARLDDATRTERLRALAGVSREWSWPGLDPAKVHILGDGVATRLYRRYPRLVHGPFRPHIAPTRRRGGRRLMDAARKAGDDELVDLLASHYATRAAYPLPVIGTTGQGEIPRIVGELARSFELLRDRDEKAFARRAANILTQIPASSIHGYDQLIRTNALARLMFVRSFGAFLSVPEAVRDLVEGAEIHVQTLAYRVLAQDDDRARRLAVESLEILLGTLLGPLYRKTRLATFGALANAARGDAAAAARVLKRSREALRLPDKKYPKEELVGLIGMILHDRPELRGPRERPVVYGLEEVGA